VKIQFPRLSFVEDLKQSIRNVVSVGNDVLSLLQDRLARVSREQVVAITASSTADQPFIVPHSLGEIPDFAHGVLEASGSIYFTPDDKAEWNASSIKVRCTSANKRTHIVIKSGLGVTQV
jgi:hypothetical protein